MKKFKHLIGALLLAALLVFTGLLVSSFAVRNRIDQRVYQDHTDELVNNGSLMLEPDNNGLNIIVIQLKNPALVDNGEYSVSLKHESEIIRTTKLSSFNVGDPSDFRFQFEPVLDSQGKSYELKIVQESGDLSKLKIGVNQDGKVSYTSYYRASGKIELFVSSFTNFVTSLLSDIVFVTIWIGTISLSIWFGLKKNK